MKNSLLDKNRPFDALSLGEIMLRLSPPGNERIVRGDSFDKRCGGAEMNVVSGISMLEMHTGIISKVPDNYIGTFIKNRMRFCGVSDDFLVYDKSEDARLGVYYYENGVHPRRPSVVYDRKHSSINSLMLSEIPEEVYHSTRLFHTCGISLALSPQCREVTMEVIKRFKKAGTFISFDVNYRANLWSEETARETLEKVFPYVDILFVSEETSRRMFQKTGDLEHIMKSYCDEFGVSIVATTERTVISPKKHSFTSTIYSAKTNQFYREKPYTDIEVVDRIGSGDAYVAGALFGLLKYQDYQKAVEFGNAMSAVKNTVPGDLPATDFKEISSTIAAHQSTGIQSEMNR